MPDIGIKPQFARAGRLLTLCLLLAQAAACNFSDPAATNGATSKVSLVQEKVLSLTTDTEGFSSRPETAVTDSRIFTFYLKNNKSFDIKIFDSSLYTALSTSTLVMESSAYGTPTDLRIVQDNSFAYLFYETVNVNSTYLWASKYNLNDAFDRVAATDMPIVTGKSVMNLAEGEEVLNDPAPLLTPNSLFILTRLMSSLSTTGKCIYRVRELSTQDLSQVNQFDLDLSSVAKGRARVSSLFYYNNAIYMAVPSTVSDEGLFDNLISNDGALTEILLLKMQSDWTFDPQTDARTLSSDTGYIENYVNGFQTDGTNVYMSYKQSYGVVGSGEQSAIVKIYDMSFNELLKQTMKKVTWGFGEIRPSQQLLGATFYSGQTNNQSGGPGDAQLGIYHVVH